MLSIMRRACLNLTFLHEHQIFITCHNIHVTINIHCQVVSRSTKVGQKRKHTTRSAKNAIYIMHVYIYIYIYIYIHCIILPVSCVYIQEETDFSPSIHRSPDMGRKSQQAKSPFPEAERSIIMRETRNTRSRWREILHNPQFQEQVHLVGA